jgi:hypothetical protein
LEALGKWYVLYNSRSESFKIVFFSDLHWLAAACAEKEVLKTRDEIKNDDHSFPIGGGDYAEFIGYEDKKRFDPDAVSERLKIKDLGKLGKKSYEEVAGIFRPIKQKVLGMIVGNHEREYLRRKQQEDLHAWMCTELGVLNAGYSCFMDLVFVRTSSVKKPTLLRGVPAGIKSTSHAETFRVFCHHGAGAAQTKGGKINRLVSFMRNFEADIFFMGHVHDQMGARLTPLGCNADCTKITHRTKVGVISGSYLKTYAQGVTTYGEQKGYEPVTLGAAWVRIFPDSRRLEAPV